MSEESTQAASGGVNWGREVLASVVVFFVALPLCMGIAIASGVPPALGLWTGIVGGIVVGFLAGSPLQVSGPAAGLTVLIFDLVQKYPNGEFFKIIAVVVFLAGLLQMAAGVLRLGQWFRAVSPSVIHGMLAGIGVLIFASQFHVMVDDKPRSKGWANLLSIPEAIYKGVFPLDGSVHHIAAAIGLLTVLILLTWNAFRPKSLQMVPGALLAIVIVALVCTIFDPKINYVKVPKNLATSINWLDVGSFWSYFQRAEIWVSALAIAFIASAETLLCATAVDQMHQGVRTNYDKELFAQGVGNTLCGVLGALPMTGVIVRSSANVDAGAKTRFSAIFHGFWLLGTVALVPGLLAHIPTSALAAILVYTGYKLVDFSYMQELRNFGRSEVGIYLATLVAIVATNLLTGVIIGVVLAVLKLLHTFSHLVIHVSHDDKHKQADMHLGGAATFIRLPMLAAELEKLPRDIQLSVHLSNLSYIDHACIDLLFSWGKQMEQMGGALLIEWEDLNKRYKARDAVDQRLEQTVTEFHVARTSSQEVPAFTDEDIERAKLASETEGGGCEHIC
ncbi:MAG: SulP family inorganic anion transporter [Myxococcales bacterium]|nr:SulP family inorganic anion transporter [Myxococcales bacterium]